MTDLDLLIVHQFDPYAKPLGGIDTCIHGIIKYLDHDIRIGIIGAIMPGREVGAKADQVGVGSVEVVNGRSIWFLPVVDLVSDGQKSDRIPSSLRLICGATRYRMKIPTTAEIQTHRQLTGAFVKVLWPKIPHRYFIHSQSSGLVSETSDSYWRHVPALQKLNERLAIRGASQIRVFNPEHAVEVAAINSNARFSPTWWDPDLVSDSSKDLPGHMALWVGRIESPKNLELALDAIHWLKHSYPEEPWKLQIAGHGSLFGAMVSKCDDLKLQDRVEFLGRVSHAQLKTTRASCDLMVMTTHPGYEGYPRVLIEGLACSLPAVVTFGSDTGNIIQCGYNGFTVQYNSADLGEGMRKARLLERGHASESVSHLAAPSVVAELYEDKISLASGVRT